MYWLALIAYNLLFPVLFLLYSPFYLVKLVRRGGWWAGFGERFGWFSRAKRARLRALPEPVWIHAVSVGEAQAALTLIREWNQRAPGMSFVISTTTSTGQRLCREKAPANVVTIYLPLDWLPCVWLGLRAVRPRALLVMEVEVWPNLIMRARAQGIPVAWVNARLSDRSAAGFARHRWFFRHLFARLSLLCVQTPEDARRVAQVLGQPDVAKVCATIKFDQVPEPRPSTVTALVQQLFPPSPERLLFCAASTHAGEEALMAAAVNELRPQYPGLGLILVPRHAERAPSIVETLRAAGLPPVVLTEFRAGTPPPAGPRVLLANTTGELMDFMGAADVVYVGKSLAGNTGGHNIIEPALLGKPVLFGSHTENFREVVRIYLDHQAAVEVADERALVTTLGRLLGDPAERARLGQAARQTTEEHRGACRRTLAHLAAIGVRGAPAEASSPPT